MNMISKGCDAAVKEIQKRFKQARLVALSGNLCTDKKSSARNWVEGRGKSVVVRVLNQLLVLVVVVACCMLRSGVFVFSPNIPLP